MTSVLVEMDHLERVPEITEVDKGENEIKVRSGGVLLDPEVGPHSEVGTQTWRRPEELDQPVSLQPSSRRVW